MLAINACSYMPVDAWTEAMMALNRELETRKRDGWRMTNRRQPRILVTGSPMVFPNIKVPLLVDELGGTVIADETCMGDRFLYDPLVITDPSFDGIMRSLANRSLRPCTCPIFPDNEKRIYRLRQMVKKNGIDGVIYHVLRGCLVYDFEYLRLEQELQELGVPVIRLESDYNEEDIEQLRVRIEAFMELIRFSGKK